MVGNLLLRGMLVGIFAGILAFGFAKIYGEPQVDRAIAFEEQTARPQARRPNRKSSAAARRPASAC